jgi:addiction module HigA family antidote
MTSLDNMHRKWKKALGYRRAYTRLGAEFAVMKKAIRARAIARRPIHPGEILADELKALGMSAAELARALRVPANRVSQIAAGKRAISADTALRLGRWFGTGPQLWLNLQQAYDLDRAVRDGKRDIEGIVPRKAA